MVSWERGVFAMVCTTLSCMVSGAEVIDGFVGMIGQEVEACVVLVKTIVMRGGCVILGEVHKELDHVWCKYVF